jgi:hypothetical protein
VVSYFDDGDTLKLSADDVLEGHRDQMDKSFMRTLVTPAVRRHVFDKFCESGLIVEVEDEDSFEENFEVWRVGEDQSVYPPADTEYYWTDVELCLPPSSSSEQSETDF